jgi:hypothetical protein
MGEDVFGVGRRMSRQSNLAEIWSARTCSRFESGPAVAGSPHPKRRCNINPEHFRGQMIVFVFGGPVPVGSGC